MSRPRKSDPQEKSARPARGKPTAAERAADGAARRKEPRGGGRTPGRAGAVSEDRSEPPVGVPVPANRSPRLDPRRPIGAFDYHLLAEGTPLRLWEHMGAIVDPGGGGVHFALWAPNARAVSVIGEWNGWDPARDRLRPTAGGVWTGFVPAARRGMHYK